MEQSWIRADLKFRAKDALRKNYWAVVIVSLILLILTGSGGHGGLASNPVGNSPYSSGSYIVDGANGIRSFWSSVYFSPVQWIAAAAGIVFLLVFIALTLGFTLFVGNVIEVGGKRFYIENLYSNPGVGKIFYGFQNGGYLNIVKTMFLRDLYSTLWSLLFIVPGIIKYYEYRMVPYLLAEYPDMPSEEVFARSKEMMYGNKWDAFVLDLSFLPWLILSGLTIGIAGIFYVNPYRDATNAELYDVLAGYIQNGSGSSQAYYN